VAAAIDVNQPKQRPNQHRARTNQNPNQRRLRQARHGVHRALHRIRLDGLGAAAAGVGGFYLRGGFGLVVERRDWD
jgi:hypothetical protein